MAEAGGLAGDPPRSSTATILFSELVGSTAWRARLAGAVPSTATFPFTAPCQVVPSASLPDVPVVGVRVEHNPPLDGSPITSAAYPSN